MLYLAAGVLYFLFVCVVFYGYELLYYGWPVIPLVMGHRCWHRWNRAA